MRSIGVSHEKPLGFFEEADASLDETAPALSTARSVHIRMLSAAEHADRHCLMGNCRRRAPGSRPGAPPPSSSIASHQGTALVSARRARRASRLAPRCQQRGPPKAYRLQLSRARRRRLRTRRAEAGSRQGPRRPLDVERDEREPGWLEGSVRHPANQAPDRAAADRDEPVQQGRSARSAAGGRMAMLGRASSGFPLLPICENSCQPVVPTA